MILAKVLKPVVMTHKHASLQNEKVLLVQPVDHNKKPVSDTFMALDRAQSGIGDLVLVLREGSGVRQIKGRDLNLPVEDAIVQAMPTRSMIVAVVDQVHVG